MSESSVVDEDDLTRPSDLDYKLRPRPIDVNQKLNIVFPDDEDIDEADELFETPIKVSIDYFERKKPKNIPIPVFKELEHPTYKMKPFVRPKNYIVYQEPSDEAKILKSEYELDSEDEEFIRAINEFFRRKEKKKDAKKILNEDKFEQLIDFFEKEWAFENENKIKAALEFDPVDTPCSVCGDTKSDRDNEIIFCDGCNVAVHQKCYGLKKIPKGEWHCHRCQAGLADVAGCVLCTEKSGALKKTQDGRWVHLSCALAFPEIYFHRPDTRDVIDGLEDIPSRNRAQTCIYCEERKGACVKCAEPNCDNYFHVTCAQKRGLYFTFSTCPSPNLTRRQLETKTKTNNAKNARGVASLSQSLPLRDKSAKTTASGNSPSERLVDDSLPASAPFLSSSVPTERVLLQLYCIRHSVRPESVDNPNFKGHLFINKTLSTEEIDELRHFALKSRRKLSLSPLRLELCYRYFLMRRKLSGNKPLIHRLVLMSAEERLVKERREKLKVNEEKLSLLKKLRRDVEYVRLLVDLSRKREILKRNHLILYTDLLNALEQQSKFVSLDRDEGNTTTDTLSLVREENESHSPKKLKSQHKNKNTRHRRKSPLKSPRTNGVIQSQNDSVPSSPSASPSPLPSLSPNKPRTLQTRSSPSNWNTSPNSSNNVDESDHRSDGGESSQWEGHRTVVEAEVDKKQSPSLPIDPKLIERVHYDRRLTKGRPTLNSKKRAAEMISLPSLSAPSSPSHLSLRSVPFTDHKRLTPNTNRFYDIYDTTVASHSDVDGDGDMSNNETGDGEYRSNSSSGHNSSSDHIVDDDSDVAVNHHSTLKSTLSTRSRRTLHEVTDSSSMYTSRRHSSKRKNVFLSKREPPQKKQKFAY
jgi:hypothetical protein